MIGSGDTMACQHLCTNTPVHIQGQNFSLDLHILPLGGTEVVLGIPWLQSLGPILTDYTTLTMSFTLMGRPITLRADAAFKPNDISAPQLKRSLQTNAVSSFFHLAITSVEQNPSPPITPHINPEISPLLNKYESLFHLPSSLPPSRPSDHHIHLLPNAHPVNVRPYRYPYFQKCEIEKQISSLLDSGLIQPLFLSGSIGEEKGRNLALLRRLPCP